MKIIKVNLSKPEEEIVRRIAEALADGKVVVMPFDTSYGLAVDATCEGAIERLLLVKERDRGKPVSVVVRDFPMLEDIAEVPSEALRKFILKYVPGKITIVLNLKDKENSALKILSAGTGTIGVRIPSSVLIKEVGYAFNKPFTATSANISGENPSFSAVEVIKQFEGKKSQPDLIVDGGVLPQSEMSTVVDATVEPPLVLRQGAVEIEEAE